MERSDGYFCLDVGLLVVGGWLMVIGVYIHK